MPKAKLDHAFCLNAQCEDGKRKTDYYDEAVTGFVFECRSTGGRTYYLRFQDAAGRQRQHKIGRWEDVTFAQAKKAAQRLRSEVVMGGDPAAEKAKARAVPLYAELAAQHMSDAKLHQRSYSTTEGYMRRHVVPRWGKVRLTDIDGRDVAHWLAGLRSTGLAPATVLKVKMIFSRSFELGAQWQVPGCERNPVRGVKLPPVNNARDRYLTAEEAARLKEAASASRNPRLRDIVELLLFTGARVGELLNARWDDIDVERQIWRVPLSKNGKTLHKPLAAPALRVIAGLPKFAGCPWLLPNPNTLRPFTDLKHPWQTTRNLARLPELRLHDLRHTACSFLIAAGVDLFTAGKILGHASIQSTQRYSHLANGQLLAAVEAGAAKQAAA